MGAAPIAQNLFVECHAGRCRGGVVASRRCLWVAYIRDAVRLACYFFFGCTRWYGVVFDVVVIMEA